MLIFKFLFASRLRAIQLECLISWIEPGEQPNKLPKIKDESYARTDCRYRIVGQLTMGFPERCWKQSRTSPIVMWRWRLSGICGGSMVWSVLPYLRIEGRLVPSGTAALEVQEQTPQKQLASAVWLVTGCKNGVSSYEIARDLGLRKRQLGA
jgi:hypothetical protein